MSVNRVGGSRDAFQEQSILPVCASNTSCAPPGRNATVTVRATSSHRRECLPSFALLHHHILAKSAVAHNVRRIRSAGPAPEELDDLRTFIAK